MWFSVIISHRKMNHDIFKYMCPFIFVYLKNSFSSAISTTFGAMFICTIKYNVPRNIYFCNKMKRWLLNVDCRACKFICNIFYVNFSTRTIIQAICIHNEIFAYFSLFTLILFHFYSFISAESNWLIYFNKFPVPSTSYVLLDYNALCKF